MKQQRALPNPKNPPPPPPPGLGKPRKDAIDRVSADQAPKKWKLILSEHGPDGHEHVISIEYYRWKWQASLAALWSYIIWDEGQFYELHARVQEVVQ